MLAVQTEYISIAACHSEAKISIVLETILQPGLGSWSMNSNGKAFADPTSTLHNAYYEQLLKKRITYSMYTCGLESNGVCHIVL